MFKNAFPEFLKHGTGNAIGKTVELHAIHKEGHEILLDMFQLDMILQQRKIMKSNNN